MKEAAEVARRELALGEYAAEWVETRTNSRGEPVRPRTIESYEWYLRPAGVTTKKDKTGQWWTARRDARLVGSRRPPAYEFTKSVLRTAVEDGIIEKNPCQIRGGSTASTLQEGGAADR